MNLSAELTAQIDAEAAEIFAYVPITPYTTEYDGEAVTLNLRRNGTVVDATEAAIVNGQVNAAFAIDRFSDVEYEVETVFRGMRGMSDKLTFPVTVVNDGDVDQDGIRDYLDGFGWLSDGYSELSDGVTFASIHVSVPPSYSNPVIDISYDASSPTEIGYSEGEAFILPSGSLRIWTLDGSEARNAADVLDVGDFVAPGQYSTGDLGLSAGHSVTLYVEAVRESINIGDRVVSITVTDSAMGRTTRQQIGFTVTRFELEGRGLDGMFHPVDHYVASTLTSDAPENRSEAWQTYRVNIYDPRPIGGISTVQIEGQSLPLNRVGDHYETPEFYAITPPSAIPQYASYIVIDGEEADWEYNPSGRSKYLEALNLNLWDQELAQKVIDVIDQLEADVAAGNVVPDPNDPGWFGKQVHQRVSSNLTGPRWRTDVYVSNADFRTIVAVGGPPPGGTTGTTQIDILHLKDGYNPQQGQVLDATKVEDLYDIKASVSGTIAQEQKVRLKKVLNGGIADGPRKIKTALPHKLFVPSTNSFIPNSKYRNGFKLLGMIGLALGSAQTAHAVWTFDADDPEFDMLLTEARLIKREPGISPTEKALNWINGPLQQFLLDRFGPEYASLMVRALDAETVWKVMTDLE